MKCKEIIEKLPMSEDEIPMYLRYGTYLKRELYNLSDNCIRARYKQYNIILKYDDSYIDFFLRKHD